MRFITDRITKHRQKPSQKVCAPLMAYTQQHISKIDWNTDCLEAQRVSFDPLLCGQPQYNAPLLHRLVIQMHHADSPLADADSADRSQQCTQSQSFQNRLQQHASSPLYSYIAEAVITPAFSSR